MKQIRNLSNAWDNGAISYATLSVEETQEFKRTTGAVRVVAMQWEFDERLYRRGGSDCFVQPLPDGSGLVYLIEDSSALVILNGDNTERLRIGVPRVDERSRPENGWLSLPKCSDAEGLGGIRHGCEGSDGYTDYLFEFDWTTGALLKAVRPPRHW